MLLVPFAASIAFAWLLSGVLPTVSTVPMAILRWLLIALASTSVMVGFDRLARRLLPLAALLNLTLAFPDQAPSRFKIAMRTGTTQQLRKVVAEARAGRIGETPTEAAENLLELVAALGLHDRLTRGHAERVRAYTHMVAEELGISGAELEHLRWSALLHDIGKLLIAAEILNKPGTLTGAEYEVVKHHPELGRELVAPLVGWLGDASRAVWEHHERWDGTGYPRGIAGTEISLAGRIVAVADAFDVMTSARSYKVPITSVAARAELARCAGSHFDAAVVRAFLNVSLGRLRMAMGPLSWLTQLSFVPQALVTAGASGATALTAIVGFGAGALGVGLSDDGVISAEETEQSASPASDVIDDVIGQPVPVGGTAPGQVGGVGTSSSSVPIGGQATSTTSTVPSGTIVAPGSGATTTAPSTALGTTITDPIPDTDAQDTVPPDTVPPDIVPPDIVPPDIVPPDIVPPDTVRPETVPATTAPAPTPPITASPTAMHDMTLYLTSPGTGDVAWQRYLPLTTDSPLSPLSPPVPDYDTDGEPGLTLRYESGSGQDESEQSFRWDAPEAVQVRGTVDVVLHAMRRNSDGSFMLDVRLRSCRGDECTEIKYQRVAADPLVADYETLHLDLGSIDTTLAPGDALELLIVAPESGKQVWLAYDTPFTPSHLTFHQT